MAAAHPVRILMFPQEPGSTESRTLHLAGSPAAGERYEDSGYVLVDGLGRALNGRQLRERAYKVMDANGLRRVRLYDARASCFTYLANNGVPDHLLARWAGHTNVRTTKRWYVKPGVEDLRPAADAWGGLVSGSTPALEGNVRCGSVSG
ncbi:tyrosine-type recombinase/integrase [Streptomyces sp. NPDC002671]